MKVQGRVPFVKEKVGTDDDHGLFFRLVCLTRFETLGQMMRIVTSNPESTSSEISISVKHGCEKPEQPARVSEIKEFQVCGMGESTT